MSVTPDSDISIKLIDIDCCPPQQGADIHMMYDGCLQAHVMTVRLHGRRRNMVRIADSGVGRPDQWGLAINQALHMLYNIPETPC